METRGERDDVGRVSCLCRAERQKGKVAGGGDGREDVRRERKIGYPRDYSRSRLILLTGANYP